MMKRIGVVLVAVMATGCMQANDAKKAVAREMLDPASVQFREVKTVRQAGGSSAVCGQYNAKNGFGAYVGFQDFAYHAGEVFLKTPERNIHTMEDAEASVRAMRAVSDLCVLAGRSLEEIEAETAKHLQAVERMKSVP